jgi:hypothetical protein
LLPQKWLYHWFSGQPLAFDYPHLHLYLILPLVKKLGIIQAQNYYALGSLVAYAVFAFFLFRQLSQNVIFSGLLSVGVAYSASLYPALTTIGSVTFFATQVFLPLSLYFLAKWRPQEGQKERQGPKAKFFYLSSIFTGLSLFGHTTASILFILPVTALVVFSFESQNKVKKTFLYLLLSSLVGIGGLFPYLGSLLRGLFGEGWEANFTGFPNKGDFLKNFGGTHPLLLLAFTFWLIVAILKKRFFRNPYWRALAYLFFFNLLLFLNLNPFTGNVSTRSLWVFPLILGALSAFFYNQFQFFSKRWSSKLIFNAILLVVLVFFQDWSLEAMEGRAGGAYVYPPSLAHNLSQAELDELKNKLVPEWVEANSKQERLYSLNDRFNMWWSAFYDRPLVRGYYPGLPLFQRESFLNQLDVSLMDNLMIEKLGMSQERAENVARFYLDWQAIKYLASTGRFQLSSYLEKESVIKREEVKSSVNYTEFEENLYSPILAPTNSPTLCLLGSDNAFNYFIRGLARFNLNSNILIPIKGPSHIENVRKKFLENCDGLVLYDLRTRFWWPLKGGWKALEEAIRSGKSVFIENGEPKSAGAKSGFLPDLFPISQTTLGTIDEKWNLKTSQDELLEGVNLDLFSPPVWENYAWKFSYSVPESIKDWAKPVLENHQHPVLVSGFFGQGQVIWSGLNLPFHMDYYDNPEEAKLFLNIIEQITPQLEKKEVPFEIDWVSPEERIITTNQAKGIIFKERGWNGWVARTSQGEKLKIHSAGPNYPGFIYLRLPKNFKEGSISFDYRGASLAWLYFFTTLITLLFLLDEIIFKGKLLSQRFKNELALLAEKLKLTKKWWSEEEEYD